MTPKHIHDFNIEYQHRTKEQTKIKIKCVYCKYFKIYKLDGQSK